MTIDEYKGPGRVGNYLQDKGGGILQALSQIAGQIGGMQRQGQAEEEDNQWKKSLIGLARKRGILPAMGPYQQEDLSSGHLEKFVGMGTPAAKGGGSGNPVLDSVTKLLSNSMISIMNPKFNQALKKKYKGLTGLEWDPNASEDDSADSVFK